MKNSKPALSICIPTFNRLHYLKESLDILLPQAQRLDVEVCVSDNHSTDGTVGYLTEMAEKFSCLHYCVQKENVGLEKNMILAISMGESDYILPIGDDEVLPDGAVEILLNEIDESFDVIILDGWHTDANLLPQRRHLPDTVRGVTFIAPAEAFINLWDKMPPGSFFASRECFSPGYSDRYIGTSHAYTGAVWDALADKYIKTGACKVKCMSIPTVLLRGGEKSWRNDAVKIRLYEIPLWFQLVMKKDVYKSVVPPILNKFIQSRANLMRLLDYRASGQLNKNMYSMIAGIYSEPRMALIRMVIAIPVIPLKLFFHINHGTRNIAQQIIGR